MATAGVLTCRELLAGKSTTSAPLVHVNMQRRAVDGPRGRLRPEYINHFWSYDVVYHRKDDVRPNGNDFDFCIGGFE